MHVSIATAEHVIEALTSEARKGIAFLYPAIDRLEAPIYVTDAHGVITHFNASCVRFSGRTPTVGKDQWCVTWKLYSVDGSPLPHDECPMARAIKDARPLRGAYADAERPDGTRVRFTPFPTPIFDTQGVLLGAINILIDVSDSRQIAELRSNAERCRRLAKSVMEEDVAASLKRLAAEYEGTALDLITVSKRQPIK